MNNKIGSLLLGITLGGILIIGHSFLTTQDIEVKKGPGNIGEINDEQITRISQRTGIAEEDIKSRLESGESMRDIMGANSRPEGGGEGRTRSE